MELNKGRKKYRYQTSINEQAKRNERMQKKTPLLFFQTTRRTAQLAAKTIFPFEVAFRHFPTAPVECQTQTESKPPLNLSGLRPQIDGASKAKETHLPQRQEKK